MLPISCVYLAYNSPSSTAVDSFLKCRRRNADLPVALRVRGASLLRYFKVRCSLNERGLPYETKLIAMKIAAKNHRKGIAGKNTDE